MVLVPSPSVHSDDISDSVISGAIYDNAMVGYPILLVFCTRLAPGIIPLFLFLQLHHVDVPVSKPIAPVTYMWRPCCQQNGDTNFAAHESEKCNRPESTAGHSTFRQLWVWIHASAFSEGYGALKLACQKEVYIILSMDLLQNTQGTI